MNQERRAYLQSMKERILDVLSREWLIDTDANRFSPLWQDLSRIDKELNHEKEIGS